MAYVKDEMAVRQNDEQTTNATQQAGKTTCGSAKRTGRTEQKTAAPQEAAGGEKQTGKTSGSPKRQRRGKKRGIDRLKEAVNKVVSRECAELAASLLNGAKDGNVTSAKLLVLLAESVKPPERKGESPLRLLIDKLGQEPEWKNPEEGLDDDAVDDYDEPAKIAG